MITVVVPVMNEQDNLAPLISEIMSASLHVLITEIIYVDDGSTDNTFAVLQSLKTTTPSLRVLRHDKRCGQSSALWTGIRAATNPLICTLDGDGQNDPADIALLYHLYETSPAHGHKIMVAGQRLKRKDNLGKRLSSRFANWLRASLLKDKTRDTGCSLKMFTREDYLNLPFFDHMHRYLPALMIRNGIQVKHVDVSHRPRVTGISKYTNFGRALVGISDLLGVMWLQRRANPLPVISEGGDSYNSERLSA